MDLFMDDPRAKCLYWGLILVILIVVWWSLSSAEHMGEWSAALVNQSNNERSAAGAATIDNGGQEWADALTNQANHELSAMKALSENFASRRSLNVDSREAELEGRLFGTDPFKHTV